MNDLHFSTFVLRTSPFELHLRGQRIKLRRQALQVLKLFLDNAGETVTHASIRSHLWGDRAIDHAKAIPLIVRDIRSALGEAATAPVLIETIPREGYRFTGAVTAKSRRSRIKWQFATPIAAVVLGIGFALPTLFTRTAVTTSEIGAAEALFLKGSHLLHKGDTSSLIRSEAYFRDALKQNENHANSIAGLAEIAVRRDQYSEAKSYTLAAMKIEDTPRAHLVNAMIAVSKDWDWQAAQKHTSHALRSSSQQLPEAWSMQAMLETLRGDHTAAITASNRAYSLDPVSALIRVDHGWFHYYARDFSTAYDLCFEAAMLELDNWAATYCMLKSANALQDKSKALQAAHAVQNLWRADATGQVAQSVVAFREWHIRVLEKQHQETGTLFEALAAEYVLSGQIKRALALLQEAADQRSKHLPLALMDPVFDPIRNHPEYTKLVALTGIEEDTVPPHSL